MENIDRKGIIQKMKTHEKYLTEFWNVSRALTDFEEKSDKHETDINKIEKLLDTMISDFSKILKKISSKIEQAWFSDEGYDARAMRIMRYISHNLTFIVQQKSMDIDIQDKKKHAALKKIDTNIKDIAQHFRDRVWSGFGVNEVKELIKYSKFIKTEIGKFKKI